MNNDFSLEPYIAVVNSETALFTRSIRNLHPMTGEMNYYTAFGGEYIKVLPLLACEAVCGDYTPARHIAAGYSILIDVASKVLDDAIDGTKQRDKRDAFHIKYGLKEVIPVSAAMQAITYDILATYIEEGYPPKTVSKLMRSMSEKIISASKGEIEDARIGEKLAKGEEVNVNEYFSAAKKGSALISSGIKWGTVIGGASEHISDILDVYGEDNGQALQILNDVNDIIGSEKDMGRPFFLDMQNYRSNIVIIDVLSKLQNGQSSSRDFIYGLFGRELKREDVLKARKILLESNSIADSLEKARKLTQQSRNGLDVLKDSKAKNYMLGISDKILGTIEALEFPVA